MSEEGIKLINNGMAANNIEIEPFKNNEAGGAKLRSLKTARVQSPSSIITYRQCPRKYYYHYIENLPTKPSIHTIRGKIVHSVLQAEAAIPHPEPFQQSLGKERSCDEET